MAGEAEDEGPHREPHQGGLPTTKKKSLQIDATYMGCREKATLNLSKHFKLYATLNLQN